jgi:ATP-dependent DNA ligase
LLQAGGVCRQNISDIWFGNLRECEIVFREASKLGCDGIVSKRLGSLYRSGRSPHWVKVKNPNAPAVKREAEEDWGSPHWIKSREAAASRRES